MEVVQIGPGEVAAVVAGATLFDEPPDPEAVRAYLEHDRNVLFLAYDERRPVGFLRGTALGQIHSSRKQMFLYEIAVAEGHRRSGVGRAMIEALLHYCRARNFEEIFVFTDPGNEPAVGLYRSTGAVTETPADRMFVYRLLGSP